MIRGGAYGVFPTLTSTNATTNSADLAPYYAIPKNVSINQRDSSYDQLTFVHNDGVTPIDGHYHQLAPPSGFDEIARYENNSELYRAKANTEAVIFHPTNDYAWNEYWVSYPLIYWSDDPSGGNIYKFMCMLTAIIMAVDSASEPVATRSAINGIIVHKPTVIKTTLESKLEQLKELWRELFGTVPDPTEITSFPKPEFRERKTVRFRRDGLDLRSRSSSSQTEELGPLMSGSEIVELGDPPELDSPYELVDT
jgi:hypothetical protein